jgi:hypothetical protein
MAEELTPVERFLDPLARLARKHPGIEGMVFWGGPQGWDPTPSEALESEEIAFYAEGLLLDGFRMQWWLLAAADRPGVADHLRLQFWQDEGPAPVVPPGWVVLAGDGWAGAAAG